MPYDDAFFIMASYVTPDAIGVGKIQPLLRYQAAYNDDGGPDVSMIEAQVSYVMKTTSRSFRSVTSTPT